MSDSTVKNKFARRLDFGIDDSPLTPTNDSPKSCKVLKWGRSTETLAIDLDSSYQCLKNHRRKPQTDENPFSSTYQDSLLNQSVETKRHSDLFDALPSSKKNGRVKKSVRQQSPKVSSTSKARLNIQDSNRISVANKVSKTKKPPKELSNTPSITNYLIGAKNSEKSLTKSPGKVVESTERLTTSSKFLVTNCPTRNTAPVYGRSPSFKSSSHREWKDTKCSPVRSQKLDIPIITDSVESPSFVVATPPVRRHRSSKRKRNSMKENQTTNDLGLVVAKTDKDSESAIDAPSSASPSLLKKPKLHRKSFETEECLKPYPMTPTKIEVVPNKLGINCGDILLSSITDSNNLQFSPVISTKKKLRARRISPRHKASTVTTNNLLADKENPLEIIEKHVEFPIPVLTESTQSVDTSPQVTTKKKPRSRFMRPGRTKEVPSTSSDEITNNGTIGLDNGTKQSTPILRLDNYLEDDSREVIPSSRTTLKTPERKTQSSSVVKTLFADDEQSGFSLRQNVNTNFTAEFLPSSILPPERTEENGTIAEKPEKFVNVFKNENLLEESQDIIPSSVVPSMKCVRTITLVTGCPGTDDLLLDLEESSERCFIPSSVVQHNTRKSVKKISKSRRFNADKTPERVNAILKVPGLLEIKSSPPVAGKMTTPKRQQTPITADVGVEITRQQSKEEYLNKDNSAKAPSSGELDQLSSPPVSTRKPRCRLAGRLKKRNDNDGLGPYNPNLSYNNELGAKCSTPPLEDVLRMKSDNKQRDEDLSDVKKPQILFDTTSCYSSPISTNVSRKTPTGKVKISRCNFNENDNPVFKAFLEESFASEGKQKFDAQYSPPIKTKMLRTSRRFTPKTSPTAKLIVQSKESLDTPSSPSIKTKRIKTPRCMKNDSKHLPQKLEGNVESNIMSFNVSREIPSTIIQSPQKTVKKEKLASVDQNDLNVVRSFGPKENNLRDIFEKKHVKTPIANTTKDTQVIDLFNTETLHLVERNTKGEGWSSEGKISEILSEERSRKSRSGNEESGPSDDAFALGLKKKTVPKEGLRAALFNVRKSLASERRVREFERHKADGQLPGGKDFQVLDVWGRYPQKVLGVSDEGEAIIVIGSGVLHNSNAIYPGCWLRIYPPWEITEGENGERPVYLSIRTCQVSFGKLQQDRGKVTSYVELPVEPYIEDPSKIVLTLLGLPEPCHEPDLWFGASPSIHG